MFPCNRAHPLSRALMGGISPWEGPFIRAERMDHQPGPLQSSSSSSLPQFPSLPVCRKLQVPRFYCSCYGNGNEAVPTALLPR